MGNKFSSGKFAIAECDRCSFRYPLKQLQKLVIKGEIVNLEAGVRPRFKWKRASLELCGSGSDPCYFAVP